MKIAVQKTLAGRKEIILYSREIYVRQFTTDIMLTR